ncbi:hypothetical protein GCK72_000525 [Caenorhabditis remanei]|uniref:Uncharacterized protein n=1 Tax=Caenorhabditis remanei TaxID=31234 RepID=A0A6A5HSG6_CAERE|nr:hypothetical protein GCK72_000525 [Caenorhabditis remanei]KAF1768712.1 hypothetical protein GCK72_000525 [Caenorhabditis remanei]
MESKECDSCESLMDRIKEKMIHIEQLRKELHVKDEDIMNFKIKCDNLSLEKSWLEKEKSVFRTRAKMLEEENAILKARLHEKHAEFLESQRLLDVVHADRDECIEEKMKASKFYRSEMKKLGEENEALSKENKRLRGVEEDVTEPTEELSFKKLLTMISENRQQTGILHGDLNATRQQMESILQKISDLESQMEQNQVELVMDAEDTVSESMSVLTIGAEEEDMTLDDLLGGPLRELPGERMIEFNGEWRYDITAVWGGAPAEQLLEQEASFEMVDEQEQ